MERRATSDSCRASRVKPKSFPFPVQGEQWWRLRCQVLDSAERPANASAARTAACPPGQQGPRCVPCPNMM